MGAGTLFAFLLPLTALATPVAIRNVTLGYDLYNLLHKLHRESPIPYVLANNLTVLKEIFKMKLELQRSNLSSLYYVVEGDYHPSKASVNEKRHGTGDKLVVFQNRKEIKTIIQGHDGKLPDAVSRGRDFKVISYPIKCFFLYL